MGQRIMLVEDDRDLSEGLALSFRAEGYEVVGASGVDECMKLLQKGEVDCVILDCNLPDGDGFSLCTQIKKHCMVPILMLTARDNELDEVKALEIGMDDFMSKPFSLAVLKARVRKLLSRQEEPVMLISNGVSVDKNKCKVYKREEEINLSRQEYQILVYFLENKNQILSKEQILSHIWDSQGNYVVEHTVVVNIMRLRAKIEDDPEQPERIKTVHGMGYIWKEGCS